MYTSSGPRNWRPSDRSSRNAFMDAMMDSTMLCVMSTPCGTNQPQRAGGGAGQEGGAHGSGQPGVGSK